MFFIVVNSFRKKTARLCRFQSEAGKERFQERCQRFQETVNSFRKAVVNPIRKKSKNCQPKLGKDSQPKLGKDTWVSRYRKRKKVVSLQAEINPAEDMSRKKKEEKPAEVQALEARIRELELQNLALNTLIDVAERNGIEIRKKSGAKQ